MSVDRIFSAGRAPESPEQVQELLNNLITITNYLPGIRSSLGWRGIFRIPVKDECWTFKISGFDGVFGIYYNQSEEAGGSFFSVFNLFYFPDSEEELIDKFPINGGVFIYRENYRELIRSFPDYPEFFNYFFTGKLVIIFNPSDYGITVGIESLSKDIIISEDGVRISGQDGIKFLVEPGEPEQAIPSYSLAAAVFNLLASSLSFHLEKIPVVLLRKFSAKKRFLKNDRLLYRDSDDVTLNSLAAVFKPDDSGSSDDFFYSGEKGKEITEIIWSGDKDRVPFEFKNFTFLNTEGVKNTNSINRNLLGIEIKPPLYIISGFLGAGKTTFIKNFLEFQSQKYLFGAVIQNELGEEGLDGMLISDECRVVEMDEGCVCCSLSGNLRKGINGIISEFVPDFIILETTGAANPMNLISEIHDLKDIVKFDSVTTIVDAVNIYDTLKNYSIADDQIKAADIVVINKTDSLPPDKIEGIEKLVSAINRRCIIAKTEFGRLDPASLYESEINSRKTGLLKSVFFPVGNKTHNNDYINNFTLKLTDCPDRGHFIEKIEKLPSDIFRIKGVIKFQNEEKSSVFQYVSGRYELSESGIDNRESFLVFIGRSLNSDKLKEHFAVI